MGGGALRVTGTFLDEISHDIPSQNWGPAEWDRDFATMKKMGLDTVILIRCGHKRWLTYPSDVLMGSEGGWRPPIDLVDLFLTMAEKHGLTFWFGTYDSGQYWHAGQGDKELEINLKVVDEVWKRYGKRRAFGGWYLSLEIGRQHLPVVDIYAKLGRHCKELSGGLPTLISPYIEGTKRIYIPEDQRLTPEQHAKEWDQILAAVRGAVDVVAFQDGECSFDELPEFLEVNRRLADKHGLKSWTNAESFDRDMPIRFLPIKWEKMLLKLDAAGRAGFEKAITFEFSHFMSPNSCYAQARGLCDRYREHFGIPDPR